MAEERWLREVVEALREGRAVRTVPEPEDAPGAGTRLASLTAKPVLYVANVAEGEPLEPPPELLTHAAERGARAAAVSARLDAELSELDDEEAEHMRSELGVEESGLATVVREAFALLDLIQFFTGGQDKEARAWAIPRGTRARQAAGAIHTDMESGFVGAEITPWDALVEVGVYPGPRAGPAAGGGPRLRDARRRRGDLPLHLGDRTDVMNESPMGRASVRRGVHQHRPGKRNGNS